MEASGAVMETGGSGGLDGPVDTRAFPEGENLPPQPEAARQPHPFEVYCREALSRAGVPITKDTMALASHICGQQGVAGLAFVDKATKTQQAKKLAERAEKELDSAMAWGPAAVKIAEVAIELRLEGKAPVMQQGEHAAGGSLTGPTAAITEE